MFGAKIISLFVLLWFVQSSNTSKTSVTGKGYKVPGKRASDEWRAQVVKKLEVLIKDETQLVEILFYLTEQEDAKGGYQNSGWWRMLNDLLSSDKAFLAFAQRLLQEVDKNPQLIRDSMLKVYEHLKTQVNNSGYLLDIDALTVGGSIGFAHVWVLVTPEIQSKILIVLPQIIKRFAVSNASNAVQVDNSFGHGVAMAIVAVYLTYKAMYNIRRWWKDNISGKRVAKNIIDSCTTLVAGYGGSTAGATAGSFFGPTGTLIGSVIGGLAGSSGGGLLINMLTQELFDIPKDEALENAYNFLGVSRHATNNEINKAYRSLSLKYHPDKAGSQQEFVKLQACMEIIKVARGEEH